MRRAIVIAGAAAALGMPAAAAGQTATPHCVPAPGDCSGWYTADVNLSWTTVADFDADCDKFKFTSDGVHQRTCLVSNDGQLWLPFRVTIHRDKTPPAVAGPRFAGHVAASR